MYCYRFPDRDTFVAACGTLGWLSEPSEEAPEAVVLAYTHDRAIDEVGPIETLPGTYDEEGVELTAPVLSDGYAIDVLWRDLDESPYGWKTYEVEPSEPKHKLF